MCLLLEPSDSYYAHTLHAAFAGVNKTPEIRDVFGTRALQQGSGLYAKIGKLQGERGVYPHVDTLVRVIAGRFGRDLSGVVECWRQQYERTLEETVDARTYGDLRRGLLAILRSVPPYDPHLSRTNRFADR